MSYSTSIIAYNIGDTVRLSFTVATSTGGAVDTPVRLILDRPTAASVIYTTATLTHPTVGSWRKDIPVSESGRWTYRWDSSGSVVQSDEGAFAVFPRKATT